MNYYLLGKYDYEKINKAKESRLTLRNLTEETEIEGMRECRWRVLEFSNL